jgi:hypothetical protein
MVYGIPEVEPETHEYVSGPFVMHSIHNFTTEHVIAREMSRGGGGGGGGGWPNVVGTSEYCLPRHPSHLTLLPGLFRLNLEYL